MIKPNLRGYEIGGDSVSGYAHAGVPPRWGSRHNRLSHFRASAPDSTKDEYNISALDTLDAKEAVVVIIG